MAVGTKKVTTQVLNQTIKTNFESIKDGTGKPLKQSEGEGEDTSLLGKAMDGLDKVTEIVGKVTSAITGLIKSVTDVVNKIISGVKSIISTAMGFVNKIIEAVKGIVKDVISKIMNILGIPLKWLKTIFGKAIKFIKDLLGPIGSSLASKASIRRLMNKLGLGGKLGGLLSLGTIMGLLFGKLHDKVTFNNILNSLKKTFSPYEIAKALRMGLYRNKNAPSWYYTGYRGLDEGMSGLDGREFRALTRDKYLEGRVPFEGWDLGSVFTEYTRRGNSPTNGRDLSKLARDEKVSKMLDIHRIIDTSKSYTSLKSVAESRNSLTDIERLKVIRHSSGLINRKTDETDPSNVYRARQTLQNGFERYQGLDLGLRFTWYFRQGMRYHESQILAFNQYFNYKPSTKADFSRREELDRIASTAGVANYEVNDKITDAEFNGYKKKESIIETNLPTVKPNVAPEDEVTHILEAYRI